MAAKRKTTIDQALLSEPIPVPSSGNDTYLATLGARIRELRKSQNLSRRVVSEKSGLSQRFIAQLEAGNGNISVLRLKKLLDTLGADMSAVLTDNEITVAGDKLAARVLAAPSHVRSRIADLLDDLSPLKLDAVKSNRVALIGMRGAGKTTLGRIAAERLGLKFVELNTEIERGNGLGVGEIFSLYGEEGYRRLEREQLVAIAQRDGLVLAVAGGIVDSSKAYAFLRENFATIWLQASPDQHMARVVAQGDSRPMADNPHAMDDLHRILMSRKLHYAQADAALDTSNDEVEVSAGKLAALLGKLFLDTDRNRSARPE